LHWLASSHTIVRFRERRLSMEDYQEQEYEFWRRLEEEPLDRGKLLKRGLAAGIGLTILSTPVEALALRARILKDPPMRGRAISLKEFIAEAKKERKLNVIALPHDWANYGEIISTFKKKYGLKMDEQNPNGSSSEENQAVRSLKGDPRAPDVLDVSPALAIAGANEGLYAKYFTRNFSKVPRSMKDGRGLWVGDYWGVISFGVNGNVVDSVPRSWADLLKSEYRNRVALNGSPLTSGSALAGVFAAALGNGGSLNDIGPGIDFFARLKDAGNFIPIQATQQTIASGQTPIVIDWDYLNLAYIKEFPGAKIRVAIPATGVYGAHYCQAVNATAPHPWAARLWQEFLYSDQGQLLWLKGYSHPALFADLAKRKVIPKKLLSALPSPAAYAKVKFASLKQQSNAAALVAKEWPSKVGS
jgi:putative spermidine/putrescine transport system substrate-binding protein